MIVEQSQDDGDIKKAARLWADELPLDPFAVLGAPFIFEMLKKCLENIHFKLYCAKENNDLCGFLLVREGSTSLLSIALGKLPFRFLGSLLCLVCTRPFQLVGLFEAFLFSVSFRQVESDLPDVELAYICVRNNKHGKGVGTKLISHGFKSHSHYWVKTLAKTTKNVSFYERNSFEEAFRHKGRVILLCKATTI